MVVELQKFSIQTKVNDIVNITDNVYTALKQSKIKNGIVHISMPGSTAGITTVEFEPGLIKTDIPALWQKLIPEGPDYAHHKTWNDHNGAGHLRSFLLKPSLTVTVHDGDLLLGTWQQIVFCEFDEMPRQRTIYCQFIGEK